MLNKKVLNLIDVRKDLGTKYADIDFVVESMKNTVSFVCGEHMTTDRVSQILSGMDVNIRAPKPSDYTKGIL